MWHMPVPVSRTGTLALSTQELIRPLPPRGMSKSMMPRASIISVADLRDVSSISSTEFSGRPAWARPAFKALTISAAERWASLPHLNTQAEPALMARAAASEVTLGLLSYMIAMTPMGTSTLLIFIPLGRWCSASTLPTGSGRAAT